MKVGDLMQVDIVSVRPDATIKETVSALATAHVTGLPVVNREGQMVGVISNSAIIAAEAAIDNEKGRSALFTQTSVQDVMGPRPYTIGPAAEVREAARHMHYAGVHRLFVTTDDRLLGVISTSDIVRAVATGVL